MAVVDRQFGSQRFFSAFHAPPIVLRTDARQQRNVSGLSNRKLDSNRKEDLLRPDCAPESNLTKVRHLGQNLIAIRVNKPQNAASTRRGEGYVQSRAQSPVFLYSLDAGFLRCGTGAGTTNI